jgi:hypothetical protein
LAIKTQTNANNVDHPNHYTAGKVECIDALEAATVELQGVEAICTANAIKYLWRWKFKNGKEDLKKAIWYITHLIKKLENKELEELEEIAIANAVEDNLCRFYQSGQLSVECLRCEFGCQDEGTITCDVQGYVKE